MFTSYYARNFTPAIPSATNYYNRSGTEILQRIWAAADFLQDSARYRHKSKSTAQTLSIASLLRYDQSYQADNKSVPAEDPAGPRCSV